MQVTVKGKNTDVPDKLRALTERKLAKVQRFDDRILAMDVEFSEERNPRVADAHRVEVTLTTKHRLVRARASAPDPAAAVDRVIDRLKRQITKLKGRRVDRTKHAEGTKALPPITVEPGTADQTAEPPDGAGIVRFKKIEMQPMSPDEAVDRMDLLGHDFYLFVNAATEQVNLVYRRRGGGFGLIEPEA